MGQECTISAFQHVSVGRECIVADRVMLIDFDHGVVEVERPIRLQGIYKRDVRVGHNCWIGYGACILRGATRRRQLGGRDELGRHQGPPRQLRQRRPARAHPADARRAGDAALALAQRARFLARRGETPASRLAGVPRWASSLAAIASWTDSGAAAGSPVPPRSAPGGAGELVLAAVLAGRADTAVGSPPDSHWAILASVAERRPAGSASASASWRAPTTRRCRGSRASPGRRCRRPRGPGCAGSCGSRGA